MALKPVLGNSNIPTLSLIAKDSTAYTSGNLVVRDTTNKYLIEATATLADATVMEGIVQKTQTTGTSVEIEITPILQGLYVIADCTNNTAANQLMIAHLLTDAGTVNNTSTHSTDKDAVFIALKVVGVAADKKLFGYIVKLGQLLS